MPSLPNGSDEQTTAKVQMNAARLITAFINGIGH